mgnify:CR=1 FL=1
MKSIPKKIILLCALALAAAGNAHAQFVTDGTEKTTVRWSQLKTDSYRFVFPTEIDSLARVYAHDWEYYKPLVGHSIGRYPNEAYRLRMPVILHPYLGYSNGMVAWTPRRMEMYTGPEMVNPWPLPWHTVLAIHEQRHVSQYQFVHEKPFKIWSYFLGELPAGFFSIYHFDPSHHEGDAVAVETGLTQAGRGRSADFLEYFRASFGHGQMRNYERWRYGSQRLFTPDYYKVGYLAIGGMRAVYDKPLFMKDYYDWLVPYRKQVRKQTGMRLGKAFGGVMAWQDSLWRVSDSLRAPFQRVEQVTAPERYYLSYTGLTLADSLLYARRSGIASDTKIVAIDPSTGKVGEIAYTGADSPLSAGSDGRIYYAETLPDLRWEMHSASAIRVLDGGRSSTLLGGGRYFNPKVFVERILACETAYDGAAFVDVIEVGGGEVLARYHAPDGLTPYEAVEIGGEIFCAALSDAGEGIYRLPDFEPVLSPEFAALNHLFVSDGKLFFASDRTSVNELYSLEADGSVRQHTTLKAGGQDFTFGEDGYLYFTCLKPDGRMVCRTHVDSLPVRTVDYSLLHKYEMADKLSGQEAALQAELGGPAEEPAISESRHYSKLLHAVKLHSWMPFYADYDELSTMSAESLYTSLGLGATAFFQNDLNTFYGSVAYSAMPQIEDNTISDWLHSGILDITYRGLYPVFHGKFTFNKLGLSAQVTSYVPFNLSSDGWSRAVVPAIKFSGSPVETSVTAAVRAYSILPTRSSCCYPRWGIGGRIGLKKDFEVDRLLPYASIYGYLPGLWQTSGLRLGADFSLDPFVNTSIKKTDNISIASADFSAEYAIPFLSIDWNGLSPLAYIRNFEFIPKASVTRQWLTWDDPSITVSGGDTQFTILKAGADFQVVLGNIWFIPYNFRIGVGAAYVGGNPDPEAKPYEINFIFKTSL